MTTRTLLKAFFAKEHEDEARAVLEPSCRAGATDLIEPLMMIVRGKHPSLNSFRSAARKVSRDKRRAAHAEGRVRDGKWDAVREILGGCFHRYAATRLLGYYAEQPKVFQFLWKTASAGGFRDGIGGITERAVLALAQTLPDRAEFFLEQYTRRPFAMRRERGLEKPLAETRPHAVAAAVLIAGFPRCSAELQSRIVRTVTFGVYRSKNASAWDRAMKVAHDLPEFWVRNELAGLVYHIGFQHSDTRKGADAGALRATFREHFLDAFLDVFRDDGSIHGEEMAIAFEWGDDPRVVSACGDFFERWGGSALTEETTVALIVWLTQAKGAVVTPRLATAIDAVCARVQGACSEKEAIAQQYVDPDTQMCRDEAARQALRVAARELRKRNPYVIGTASTRMILEAAEQWRQTIRVHAPTMHTT
ncbi:hypothetical protein HY480_03560 [Candidatus Uhrbacteria bacterium]|nr:hypothetical protein [Candidatus Uhrbacteria bacterium]